MTSTTGIVPPLHRRFDESKALEQIRNRYRLLREKISRQVTALQADSGFRIHCKSLYAKGYKDWMLIAVIYNVILNVYLQENGIDLLNKKAAEKAMRDFMGRQITDVYPAALFLGEEFERCLKTFQMTVLVTWGFHPRARLLKPDVVEKFLRERMRHFDLDFPHRPLFGDELGEWPETD